MGTKIHICNRRIYCSFLIIVIALSQRVFAEESLEKTLEWRAAQWADQGKHIGVTTTSVLMSEFAKRSGFELKINPGNYFLRLIHDIKEGKGDVVLLPNILLDNFKEEDIYEKVSCEVVFVKTGIVAAGLKEKFESQPASADIHDLRIVSRAFPKEAMNTVLGEEKYEVTSSTTESLIKALLAGRADLIVDVAFSLEEVERKLGVEKRIVAVRKSPQHELFLCFSHHFIKSQDDDFLQKSQIIMNEIARDKGVQKKLEDLLGKNKVMTVGTVEMVEK